MQTSVLHSAITETACPQKEELGIEAQACAPPAQQPGLMPDTRENSLGEADGVCDGSTVEAQGGGITITPAPLLALRPVALLDTHTQRLCMLRCPGPTTCGTHMPSHTAVPPAITCRVLGPDQTEQVRFHHLI